MSGRVVGDLKPDNILLSQHNPPNIRLADFGLATFRDTLGDSTMGMSSMSQTSSTKGESALALWPAPIALH